MCNGFVQNLAEELGSYLLINVTFSFEIKFLFMNVKFRDEELRLQLSYVI